MASQTDTVQSAKRETGLVEAILNRRELAVSLAVLGLFVIGTFVRAEVFLTLGNVMGFVRNAAVIAIIGYAMTVLMTAGEFDVSVGSMMGLSGGITTVLFLAGFSIEFALLVTFLVAVLYGIVQGLLVTKLGLPSLIVTIGSLTFLRGANLVITGNQTRSISAEEFPWLLSFFGEPINLPYTLSVPGTAIDLLTIPVIRYSLPVMHKSIQTFDTFPTQIVWMLALLAIFHLFLFHTRLGYRVQTTGGDLRAARYNGIKTDQIKIFGFALVAFFAAFAGISQLAFLSSVSPVTGQGQELTIIAAVIIGGTSLFGGRGTVVGTFLGALLFTMISNILILAGFGVNLFQVFTGLFIIAALGLDSVSRKTSGTVIKELYLTPIRELARQPRQFFRNQSSQQGIDAPLSFATVTAFLWGIVAVAGVLLSVVGTPLSDGLLFSRQFELWIIGSNYEAIGTVMLFAVGISAAITFLTTVFVHLATSVVGHSDEIEMTARATAYSLAPTGLLFLPFLFAGYRFINNVVVLSLVIVFFPVLVLLYLALRELHGFVPRRTAVIVAVTAGLWGLLVLFVQAEFVAVYG